MEQAPTVLLAPDEAIRHADAFLDRLEAAFGPLLLTTPGGQGSQRHGARKLPWLGKRRWLAQLAPARVLRLGAAPPIPAPEGVPVVWINAPADADPELADRLLHAEPAAGPQPGEVTGDPVLALEAPSPPGETDLCDRFRELREAGRWICYFAGTVEGEERRAYAAFFELLRRRMGFMILAPRDPERYEPVYRDAIKYNLPTNRHNRLSTSWVPKKSRVYYVEDPQTLAGIYPCADLVVPGGTLVGDGRPPDLSTPLDRGCAVAVGPAGREHPVVASAIAAGAVAAAGDDELEETLAALLTDPERREALAAAGRAWLNRHTGALDRVLAVVTEAG
ncbi:3-deoxy-D-manno-octulosonic acid transferase [Thiohalospira sp.]|uniref:3-deoxy-D-manno-octulosonic acid transferase n=1 Tax=Thiohalospira sp. TaxID=3080549 RepID=UPI00398094AC